MHAFAGYALAAAACVQVHVGTMAGTGVAFGIRVRELWLGMGPRAFGRGLLQVRAIPLGAAVCFENAGTGSTGLPDRALFDRRSAWVQSAVLLSGCAALVLVSAATLGVDGPRAFVDGFGQFVGGAFSLTEARGLAKQAAAFAAQASWADMAGLVAAKMAALNLMPLPGTNGGNIVRIVSREFGVDRVWRDGFTAAVALGQVFLLMSWLFALLVPEWML